MEKLMVKRNVFLTHHHDDQKEVYDFFASFGDWFNSMRVLGVSDDDDFVDSDNTDYVLRRIREKYVYGTSATIALIGRCSWARKYIDWEIAATLRNNPNDPRGALLAVQLPCIDGRNDITLPKRLEMNRRYDSNAQRELGFASYHRYPNSGSSLAQWVEDAIVRRDNREPVPGSTTNLRQRNSPC